MKEQILMWYFIIGAVYLLINGIVRKLDTGGDYLLPYVWFFFWPIAFTVLGIKWIRGKMINA